MKVLLRLQQQQQQQPWLQTVCDRLRSEGHQLLFAARSLTATLKKRFFDPATQQIRGIDCLLLTHADPEDDKQAVELVRNAPNSPKLRVILISNFLTWAGRSYESADASPVECSAANLANRMPLNLASPLLLLENKLLSTAFGSGIQVFVLAIGVVYGGEGADLKRYLLDLFHKKQCQLPIRAAADALGENAQGIHTPMVHVTDAVNACVHVITATNPDALPESRYVPLVDHTSAGLLEVMNRFADELQGSVSLVTQEEQCRQILDGHHDLDWRFMANLRVAGLHDRLPELRCESLDKSSTTSAILQEFLQSNHLSDARVVLISAPGSLPSTALPRLAEHASVGFVSTLAAVEHFVNLVLPVLHAKKTELVQEAAAALPPSKSNKKGKDPAKEEPLSEDALQALEQELQTRLPPPVFKMYQLINENLVGDGRETLEKLVETTQPLPDLSSRLVEHLPSWCKQEQVVALLRLLCEHFKASGVHGYVMDGNGVISDAPNEHLEATWTQLFGDNQPTAMIEVSGADGTSSNTGDFDALWAKWEQHLQQLQISGPSSSAEPANAEQETEAKPVDATEQREEIDPDNEGFAEVDVPDDEDSAQQTQEQEPPPDIKFVTRTVHSATLFAEQRGVPTQQIRMESQELPAVLAQLGGAVVASHGPIGWLDQRGKELTSPETYLREPPPCSAVSRPSTAAQQQPSSSSSSEDRADATAEETERPKLRSPPDDGTQALLEKYKDELEERTARLMDVALSTVLPEVTQALLEIRENQPEDPLRYLINFLREREARQIAKAEAEAFLAFTGRMAIFAAEDRLAEEQQAMYAQMFASLDRDAF